MFPFRSGLNRNELLVLLTGYQDAQSDVTILLLPIGTRSLS
jgi:hypothetical protein